MQRNEKYNPYMVEGGGESTEPNSEQAQTLDLLSKDIKSVIYIWTKNF